MTAGRPAEAIPLLKDPSIAGNHEYMVPDSCGLALLAYVATGQLDEAKICLQTLQASLPPAGDADAARQMIQTCVGFHHLLKQYLAGFRDRRQDDLVKKVVQQFDAWLARRRGAGSRQSLFPGLAGGSLLRFGGGAGHRRPGRVAGRRNAVSASGCRFPGDSAPRGDGGRILARRRSRRRPAD